MAQLNPNPNPTSNVTGYVKSTSSITLTATADGMRIQKPATAGVEYIEFPGTYSNTTLWTKSWQWRRNTSASACPLSMSFAVTSYPLDGVSAVGQFVLCEVRSATGSSSFPPSLWLPADAVDITVKGLYVYNTAQTDTYGLDANDAAWSYSGSDNSLSRTFQHNPLVNERVRHAVWSWDDGSSDTNQGASAFSLSPNTFPPITRSFPTAGLYDVTLQARAGAPGAPAPYNAPPFTYSTTQQIMVPTGPFVADYTHSESSLNLSVNAGISQVPTFDTISSYTWEWGDGTPNGSGATANHTYAEPGTYAVKLTTRTPATLRVSTKTYNIVVELPPTPPADLTEAIAKSIFTGRFSSWDVGTRVEELPTPTDFSFAVPADDMPSLTMTYSLKGENGDKVRDLVGEEYDLAFEVFSPVDYQWFEPRGCRWVVQDDDLNLMDATGMVKLRAVGVANDLDGIIVTARESASVGKTFKTADGDVNAGRIMGTLLEAEIAEFDHVITRDFTNTHDSSSTAFSKELNSNYEVGSSQTFLQVLQDLTEMGLCHWSTQGNELLLFDDGSPEYGLDLAFGGADDVYLLPGREIKAIQTARSRRDYLHTLYIPKSDGTFYKREVATPVSRRGKKAQIITGNAVATSGDADLVASSVLNDAGKITREQYTYELNLSSRLGEGGALPFVDYNPGDLVWAIGATGGLEPMQVQQITLQGGAGKPLEGSVILADRILLQSVQRAKNTARALGSGAHYTNTIVGRTTTETPYVSRYNSAPQTISTGTWTALTLNANDLIAGGIIWDSTNKEFTLPVGGNYMFNAGTHWIANTTGTRFVRVLVNGSVIGTTSKEGASVDAGVYFSRPWRCSAGDKVKFEVNQNSGGDLDTWSSAGRYTFATVTKIGD